MGEDKMTHWIKRIICIFGISILTAYYIATAFFIIVAFMNGMRLILDINIYGEGLSEFILTLCSIPCVIFFIKEARMKFRKV